MERPEEISIRATSVENLSLVNQLSVPLPSPGTRLLWRLRAVYSWENQHRTMGLLNSRKLTGKALWPFFGDVPASIGQAGHIELLHQVVPP